MFWSNFILFLFLSLKLVASEPAPAAGGHGAEKKEVKYSGTQSDEWNELSKQYQAAKAKYENAEKKYESLREEFNESGGDVSAHALSEFKKSKEELDKTEEEFKQLEKDFKLRFPERGLEKGRVYKRESSEEGNGAEAVIGVDIHDSSLKQPQSLEGKMRVLNKKIDRQYQLQTEDNAMKKKNKNKSKAKTIEQELTDVSDGVTQKIILEK